VFCALSLVGLAGVAIGLLRRRTVVTNAPAWAFLIGSVAFTLVVVLFRAGATGSDGGTTHARFLFPDIIALIALLVAGLAALPRVLARAALGSFIAILSVTLGYAAWTVSGAFIWQPVYGDTISAGAQQPQAATFERGLELVGLNLPGGTIATGDQLHVRLFWSALRPIDFDYSAFLRLEDSAGHVIHDTDHVPGVQIGLLTHSWQVGEVVPDDWTIAIPADATAGQYRVQVGVYDYRNLQPLLDQTASPATTVATVTLS
ncbi:MAG TPA: hypothetical protein VFS62_07720, partial [Chloroflexota bacterium]|jgi:hypothetical protein|nr:hypothetical protein [Chloroflexota bacterium]